MDDQEGLFRAKRLAGGLKIYNFMVVSRCQRETMIGTAEGEGMLLIILMQTPFLNISLVLKRLLVAIGIGNRCELKTCRKTSSVRNANCKDLRVRSGAWN